MEKRSSDRIHKRLNIVFPCCNSFHSGTVLNLSESGMLIDTKTWVPLKSTFEILIPVKKEILKIPVKFVRLSKAGKKCINILSIIENAINIGIKANHPEIKDTNMIIINILM